MSLSKTNPAAFAAMRRLSPRRHSSQAANEEQLVAEQLTHFGLDPSSEYGQTVADIARHLYNTTVDIDNLERVTAETIGSLDRSQRIAYFNAKEFLSFKIAKRSSCRQSKSTRWFARRISKPISDTSTRNGHLIAIDDKK